MLILRCVTLLTVLGLASGHGSMSQPRSRQQHGLKVDGSDCDPTKYGNTAACTAACMGEACEWFNDGCVIGCDACTNSGEYYCNEPIRGSNPPRKSSCYPPASQNGCRVNGELSDNPPMPAEVLPLEYRTWDINGKPGCTDCSPSWGVTGKSMTENHPWRAPGYSPVTNPCGIASGTVPGLPGGGDGHGKPPAVPVGYKRAMNGTDLPQLDGPPTTWKAGSTQEVAWAILANHGGGYQYRLCPKSSEPTEACFQTMPLPFVGTTTTIRMDDNQTHPDFEIPAMDITIGTSPKGNCDLGEEGSCGAWGTANFTKPYDIDPAAKTKTPRCPTGVQFPPPWPEGYGFSTAFHSPEDEQALVDVTSSGSCKAISKDQCGTDPKLQCTKCASGSSYDCLECCPGDKKVTKGSFTYCMKPNDPKPNPKPKGNGDGWYSLVDQVRVPMVKGEYLLSFRWDCEQTAQVWNTCADVVIV